LIDPVGSIDKRRPIFQLTAAVFIHHQRVSTTIELHNPQAVLGVAGAEIAHSGGQCLCAIFLLGWNLLLPIKYTEPLGMDVMPGAMV
jgi:hypothetical protein